MDLKRLLAVTAAVALPFVLIGQSRAQDAALTARVQAAYDAQCADMIRDDIAAFQETMSPSFLASGQGAASTRDETVSFVKTVLNKVSLTACKTYIDSVTVSGNVVSAVVRHVLDGTASTALFGATGSAVRPVPVEIAGGTRDTWVQQGSGFLETSSMDLWQTTSVNGHVRSESGDVPSSQPLAPTSPTPGATP